MNDQPSIIRMAKAADLYAVWQTDDLFERRQIRDERFAALVASAEREACAKFFEEHWRETWTDEQVVEAIRARGQA